MPKHGYVWEKGQAGSRGLREGSTGSASKGQNGGTWTLGDVVARLAILPACNGRTRVGWRGLLARWTTWEGRKKKDTMGVVLAGCQLDGWMRTVVLKQIAGSAVQIVSSESYGEESSLKILIHC